MRILPEEWLTINLIDFVYKFILVKMLKVSILNLIYTISSIILIPLILDWIR